MNAMQLEAFTQQLLDHIAGGNKIEDARVELKREWPTDHAKAARRLAGLCNAARSPWVLFVVGADEYGGFGEGGPIETHEWLAQVDKHFDGITPRLVQDLKVPYRDHMVTALLFTADRTPYVWKVPQDERSRGVVREVPWRRGTEVESARREDLVRLLAPLIAVPTLELVYARLELRPRSTFPEYVWSLRTTLFIVPSSDGAVVLPVHKMTGQMRWGDGAATRELRPMTQSDYQTFPIGMVTSSTSDVTAKGPGTFHLLFYEQSMREEETTPDGDIAVDLTFGLLGSRPATSLQFTCVRNGMAGTAALWEASGE